MATFTTRPEIRGTFGAVASTHWLASAVGMSVLEKGGNAFDAAAAALLRHEAFRRGWTRADNVKTKWYKRLSFGPGWQSSAWCCRSTSSATVCMTRSIRGAVEPSRFRRRETCSNLFSANV
jgi:hypothetical protein